MNINNINTNKVTVKTSNISKIKIPMIQRDYVQGLKNEKLEPFLNTLIDALLNGQKLSLDFIYGNINEDGVFEPIDGQQRLTTLALLTFYLYCRQKGSDNNKTLNNPFKLITYATRQSAKKFCELLSIDEFKDEFKDKFDNSVVPSNVIKENPKYFSEYDEDTTISAMLKTLDKIHEIICKENIDINGLIKHIDNITFQIFPMESFNLSDDLYIKMNGRGKQLSSFDNFKADYFKWLEENINIIDELIPNITESSEDNNKNKEEEKEKERKKYKLETLKRKFDTEYLDIFWDYAFENSKDTSEAPDPEKLFFRFINRFVISKSNMSELPNDFINNSENLDYEYSSQLFDIYKKCFEKNHNIFITLLKNLTKIKNMNDYFQTSWIYKYDKDKNKDNIINFNIFDKLTYKDRFAYNNIMRFFEQKNAVEMLDEAKKYSRIIWNITEQFFTVYEVGKDNYNIAINGINDVIPNIDWSNIYESFKNLSIQQSESIMKKIIFYEKRKCEYIKTYHISEETFINLEKLSHFKGCIFFAFPNDIDNDINTYIGNLEPIFEHMNISKNFSLFIRAIISQIEKKEDLPKAYKYDSNNNGMLRALIENDNIETIAKIIIKDLLEKKVEEINSILKNNYISKESKFKNITDYKHFTLKVNHEALYKIEDLHNKYILEQSAWYRLYPYWLKTKQGNVKSDSITYCPIKKCIKAILNSPVDIDINSNGYIKYKEQYFQNEFVLLPDSQALRLENIGFEFNENETIEINTYKNVIKFCKYIEDNDHIISNENSIIIKSLLENIDDIIGFFNNLINS